MISKYHPETGSIKMHRLITQRQPPQFMTWKDDTSVIIHFFDPKVYLAEYCLQLGRDAYSHRSLSKMGEAERRLKGELPMVGTGDSFGSRASSQFMLAKSLAGNIPQADKWPPPNILAKSQVDRPKLSRNLAEYQPENRSQINEQSFRTRQWIEMNGQVRIGEMVQTWATLDFDLYTPTENHPYKGIFVGLSPFYNIFLNLLQLYVSTAFTGVNREVCLFIEFSMPYSLLPFKIFPNYLILPDLSTFYASPSLCVIIRLAWGLQQSGMLNNERLSDFRTCFICSIGSRTLNQFRTTSLTKIMQRPSKIIGSRTLKSFRSDIWTLLVWQIINKLKH